MLSTKKHFAVLTVILVGLFFILLFFFIPAKAIQLHREQSHLLLMAKLAFLSASAAISISIWLIIIFKREFDVVLELKRRKMECLGIGRADLDITDGDAVSSYIKFLKPSSIIHCAAYTAVDKAEDEPDLCFLVNETGTESIAKACRDVDAEMIYISTDYVFDGQGDTPFEVDSPKAPLSVYGRSKLAGEEAVIRHLDKFYIVRTSWVFGKHGSNFVKTMLKLAKDIREINVVDDQIGSPTFTEDLAVLLCDMSQSGKYGVYHATNEGFCSWAEFAQEIMRISDIDCVINRIKSEQYPTKAVRPKNSRLSKTDLDKVGFTRLSNWHDALKRFTIKL